MSDHHSVRNIDSSASSQFQRAHSVKDTAYSWCVCFGSFFVSFLCFGILNSFGVLFQSIVKYFGSSNAQTGWVGSLAISINFASSFFISAFYESYGPRRVTAIGICLCCLSLFASSYAPNIYVMYVTYGVGMGLGTSFLYLPSVVLLRVYFDKRLSLANGLAASGSAIGTLVLSPLITIILEKIGLLWTLRLLAASISILSFLLCIYKAGDCSSSKKRVSLPRTIKRQFSDKSLWKNRRYKMMVLAICIFFTGHLIPFFYMVNVAEHKIGETPIRASFLMCYLSIASAVGRVFFGLIISAWQLPPRKIFQVALVIMGTSHLFVPLINEYNWLCLYAIAFGFFEGCFVSQFPVVVCEVAGEEMSSTALGLIFTIMSIPMVSGPPWAGRIYDITKSYNIAFLIAGTTSIIGGLLMHTLSCMKKCDRTLNNCKGVDPLRVEKVFFTRSIHYRNVSSKQLINSTDKNDDEVFL